MDSPEPDRPPITWAGFLVGFMEPPFRIECGSCRAGEHACGGDCDCEVAWCLQRRERLGIPLPPEERRLIA